MTRYWTHYWKQKTVREHKIYEGVGLAHIGGEQFHDRGVTKGDVVYCVSLTQKGAVLLLARLRADMVTTKAVAKKRFPGDEVWDATEHLIDESDDSDLIELRFDRVIKRSVLEKLEFITNAGHSTIKFRGSGVDKQSLRKVRELTEGSAVLLDKILDAGN